MEGAWIALSVLLGSACILLGRRLLLLRRRLARIEEDWQRREEELLRRSEDRSLQQETLLDRIPSGVILLDQEGRVEQANSAVRQELGIVGECRGRSLLETIRSHELQEIFQKAVQEGRESGRELEFTDGMMRTRYYLVNATRTSEAEHVSGVILLFHDLTRFRELESRRKEFVANVSHELRTPISLIKGYVETILDGITEDPSQQESFLRKIQKHTDRLTFLTEDLLALSQLESGRVAINHSRISLPDLVQRVFENLQDRAASRRIRLEADLDPGLEIWGDYDRLFQVLQNLVDNGIKYGETQGTITVSASSGQGRCRVQVANEGQPIPPEAQERIFERFFRVDKARSREQGGTGLGLAIVKHIVQAHGGQVWLEEADSGSVFAFSIPMEPLHSPVPR